MLLELTLSVASANVGEKASSALIDFWQVELDMNQPGLHLQGICVGCWLDLFCRKQAWVGVKVGGIANKL